MRIEVAAPAAKSLITEDRMRVDVELEFYVRVQPTSEGVATAAQAIGSKSLTPDGVRNLLEGRFIDAVQATAARLTMDCLHERRAEFVARSRESVRENLEQSGMLLESVSLTRMDQAAFSAIDDNNAFNAVGLRKLAEIIATIAKSAPRSKPMPTSRCGRPNSRRSSSGCSFAPEEEQAQIDQRLEIEKLRARAMPRQPAPASSRRSRRRTRGSSARGRRGRPRSRSSASCAGSSSTRSSNYEMSKVDSAIALAAKHAEEAKAQAQAELARTEIVLAQEQLQTERERAVADRSHEMALKREKERGAVETSKAQSETDVLLVCAPRPKRRHQGWSRRSQLVGEVGRRARADRRREFAQRRPDAHAARAVPARPMPEIIWPDDEAGGEDRSIRIHQVTGFGGTCRRRTAAGNRRTSVEAADEAGDGQHSRHGAAAAGLKSIGESIGVDLSSAVTSRQQRHPARSRRNARPTMGRRAKQVVPSQHASCVTLKEKSMSVSRRTLPASGASVAAGTARMPYGHAFAAERRSSSARSSTIRQLDIYGKPMVQATAIAVDEIKPSAVCSAARSSCMQYDSQSEHRAVHQVCAAAGARRQGRRRPWRHHFGLA